ncbi:MAG: UDP-N-acetylmuramoyl-L-alanine--D-glutamate ligase [Elusimicrobiales bacterium]
MKFSRSVFAGKPGCVLGCGKSGLACAKLLAEQGFGVFASERRPLSAFASPPELPAGAEAEFGGHSDKMLCCAFAVKSPGLTPDAEALQRLRSVSIPVFSEMEIALALLPRCEVFAVTGTNGKTTVTALLGAILEEEAKLRGNRAHTAGNIGIPLSEMRPEQGDFLALEVSSYQLEDSAWFSPQAACITNITPDHMEHHGGMVNYISAKGKVFRQQQKDAVCVFNALDRHCVKLSGECPSEKLFFASGRAEAAVNGFLEKGLLRFDVNGKTCKIAPPKLPGIHNMENALTAGLMALGRGVAAASVEKAFAAFKAVEHRLEDCGQAGGVRCINDSKATNVDSALVALKALASGEKNIWLVLGGLGKGAPYAPLMPQIKRSVKTILAIGADAPKIAAELEGSAPILNCGTVDSAVASCLELAKPGDILLFSPACASFDQFRDFEHRGQYFKELVHHAQTGAV